MEQMTLLNNITGPTSITKLANLGQDNLTIVTLSAVPLNLSMTLAETTTNIIHEKYYNDNNETVVPLNVFYTSSSWLNVLKTNKLNVF